MKLKIMLLIGMAAAGVAASYALADRGHGNGREAHLATGAQCQRVHVLGTAAPQTLTVSVTRAGEKSSLAPGNTVTVMLGTGSDQVRVNVEGCLASTTTGTTTGTTTVTSLTGKTAVLHVLPAGTGTQQTATTDSQGRGKHGENEHHSTTTGTTTVTDNTQQQSPTTTQNTTP